MYLNDKHLDNKTMVETKKGKNNNAQISTVEKFDSKSVKNQNRSTLRGSKKVLSHAKTNHDGIQVSVNSDDEELDYIDDISDQDQDEVCSMDLDGHNGLELPPSSGDGNCGQKQAGTVESQEEGAEVDGIDNTLELGATSSTLTDEQLIMNNPHLQRLLNKMLDERIEKAAQAQKTGESSRSELLTRMSPNTNSVVGNKKKDKTPAKATATTSQRMDNQGTLLVKSPSDTTIYAPVLSLVPNDRTVGLSSRTERTPINEVWVNDNKINESSQISQGGQMRQNVQNVDKLKDAELMLEISDFVEQMRIQQEEIEQQGQNVEEVEQPNRPKLRMNVPGLEEAQKQMEHAIIETEKFKAAVEVLPGRKNSFDHSSLMENEINAGNIIESSVTASSVRQVGSGLTDDDFFHMTCHIDSALKSKIERGDFVDLDKLLPKDFGFQSKISKNQETKLEWIQSKGSTYLVPVSKASRINCFR